MGAMSRSKGARAENELCGMLSDALGFIVKRKIANRKGEADCVEISGWSLESKRQEKEQLKAWWAQAEEQAALTGTKPVLFFRANRQPWMAMFDLADLSSSFQRGRFQVCLPFEAAAQVIRESLG